MGGEGGSGGGEAPLVCVDSEFVNEPALPDYAATGAKMGEHCLGTDHQDVDGVERVVFLGDSMTVGTPPTQPKHFFRAQLAETLATLWGLPAPKASWRIPNPLTGQATKIEDGAFASCARWSARAADVVDEQLDQCFSGADFDKRTLVVMTVGGNDMQDVTQLALDGEPPEVVAARAAKMTADQRAILDWLNTPGRFPAGVFVVAANVYEFTDRTGGFSGCDVSSLVGFDEPLPAPDEVLGLLDEANVALVTHAATTGADVVMAMEAFCGHGFAREDDAAPCYRGAGVDRWFDLTCIHPNRAGHDVLATMFASVITE